jgi:hypothetical protein
VSKQQPTSQVWPLFGCGQPIRNVFKDEYWGDGGEMTQTLCAHMNKIKIFLKDEYLQMIWSANQEWF